MEALPIEVMLLIGDLIPHKSFSALARTCRHFHAMINPVIYERNLHPASNPRKTCLLWAAKHGRLETIKRAHSYCHGLTRAASNLIWILINSERVYFLSPLHLAIHNGFLDIAEYIKEHGADMGIPSSVVCESTDPDACYRGVHWVELARPMLGGIGDYFESNTFLQYEGVAITKEDMIKSIPIVSEPLYLMRLLIDLQFLDLHGTYSNGMSLLHSAIYVKNLSLVKILLEDPNIDLGATTKYGATPLHIAAECRDKQIMRLLLAQPGIDFEATDKRGRTALHYAASSKVQYRPVESVMRQFLDRGVDINKRDTSGNTALCLAIKRRNYAAVEELLSEGADSFIYPADPNGWSFLHHLLVKWDHSFGSVWEDWRTNLEALIELGHAYDEPCSIVNGANKRIYKTNGTPLFFATVHAQDIEAMNILLAAGARADKPVINRDADIEGVEAGQAQSFLAGVFRHHWYDLSRPDETDTPNYIRHLPWSLDQIKPRVFLLLQHGARLDPVEDEESALDFACHWDKAGPTELRSFLLSIATSNNVSIRHIRYLIIKYSRILKKEFEDYEEKKERRREGEPEVTQEPRLYHYDRVFKQLLVFITRTFPEDEVVVALDLET